MNKCSACAHYYPSESFIFKGKSYKTCINCLTSRAEKRATNKKLDNNNTETILESISPQALSDYVAGLLSNLNLMILRIIVDKILILAGTNNKHAGWSIHNCRRRVPFAVEIRFRKSAIRRSNSNGSDRSIDTSSPPDTPIHTINPALPNPSTTTATTNTATNPRNQSKRKQTSNSQNGSGDNNNNTAGSEPQIDPDIPPDTDEWGNTPGSKKKRFRARDDEPILYQDKFVAISATYLYILNYYMPDAKDKAISMTSIRNVQTDREARISDMAYQKWGSGGFDLWWARDLGRWKNHDLCVIVTVDRDWVKRKGFTLEHVDGLKILKKTWRKAKGISEQDN
ncbi:10828_t:CDS:2 [Ambispora gerdemannii]|uniref:10828_t:CDS:1 n=1 Tax=Ambispora gerdemannii TaxID=144530 RepID=A0A9N9GES5_9GLOM|nr:10828_t:CDS:2 [Ambispora gerdemannii]